MNRTGQLSPWWLLICPLALALVIYHPFLTLPLDLWDFREFVPVLRHAGNSFVSGFAALLGYYAQHGRMNPAFYITFVAQFHLFGVNASGWQWLRFGWMGLDAVLLVMVAQRIGLRVAAGVAAAILLVIATPAIRAWVQLMAEPQAVALLLLAMMIAVRYQRSLAPVRDAWLMGLLIALVFLTKEVAGALGLVIWLMAIAWQRPNGQRFVRRDAIITGILAGVAVAEAMLLHWVRHRAAATGYGMAYGAAPLSANRLLSNLVAIVMPVRSGSGARVALLYPVNVALAVVLVAAAIVRGRAPDGWRSVLRAFSWTAVPIVLGALVYLPWPKFDSFYALPFFLGPLLLFAAAIDVLLAGNRALQLLAIMATVAVAVYGSIPASRSTETAAASLRLNADLAHLFARFAPTDTVLVLSPDAGPRVLPVQAEELRDYADAMQWTTPSSAPVVRRATCAEYNPADATPRPDRVYASYSYGCGRFPDPTLRIVSEFVWRDWVTFTPITDTLTLDLTGMPLSRVLRKR